MPRWLQVSIYKKYHQSSWERPHFKFRSSCTVQKWPRGATPRPRSGMAAERSYPRPRSGAAAERSYPMSKVRAAAERSYPKSKVRAAAERSYWTSKVGVTAERSYPKSKVRGGGREDLSHIQGQEHWLCFSGAAVKRYPKSKVRETQVRRQALREGIRGQTDGNHNHRKEANLIMWTTACLIQWN